MSTEPIYCCEKFRKEYRDYEEGIEYTDIYEDGKIVKGYRFTVEGLSASGRLIYCPYCGARIDNNNNSDKNA